MTTDSFFALLCVSLITLFFGFVMTFMGYRFFLFLLPIWGFFFGFGVGAEAIQAIFGTAFLADVTSWVAGFVVRDILKPECDPVRSSLGEDDPGGGCLDGAPDEFVLGPARWNSTPLEERPRDDVVVVHGRHSH